MVHRNRILLSFSFACAWFACSGDDLGVAPSVSALTLDPFIVPVGSIRTVSATFRFGDDDGDVDRYQVSLVHPDGQTTELDEQPLDGAGVIEGTVTAAIRVFPDVEGDWIVQVELLDAADHTSTPARATLQVVADAP